MVEKNNKPEDPKDGASGDAEERKLQQAWENASRIIEHEDNLLNNRFSAYLTLQGFLFAALVGGVVGFATVNIDESLRSFIALLLFIVSIAGIISSWRILTILLGALRHIMATRFWWLAYSKDISVGSGDFKTRVNQRESSLT